MNFEIGERVKYQANAKTYPRKGTVIGTYDGYIEKSVEIKFDDSLAPLKVFNEDIKKITSFGKPNSSKSCTCGAKYTSSPNIHMAEVCDMWVPVNK
ncbi:hypothetical protein M0R04_11655 [Candidatus Dojkabacteria bacterium]|jgi:hypothetical protein|nr:hypothetical protein [Candidatus Dojkabacteria bacterium]